MPNKDPEVARRLKHEWYMRNKDYILGQKRQRRAEKKAARPPKPPREPPTPEQRAKVKEQTGWPATSTGPVI